MIEGVLSMDKNKLLVIGVVLLVFVPFVLANPYSRMQYMKKSHGTAIAGSLGTHGAATNTSSVLSQVIGPCSYDVCKIFPPKNGAKCIRPTVRVNCNDARCTDGPCSGHSKRIVAHQVMKSKLQSFSSNSGHAKLNVTTTH